MEKETPLKWIDVFALPEEAEHADSPVDTECEETGRKASEILSGKSD